LYKNKVLLLDTIPDKFVIIESGNCIAVRESIIFSEYDKNLEDIERKEESKGSNFLEDEPNPSQNEINKRLNELKNSFSFQNKRLFIVSSKKQRKIAFRHHVY